MIRVYLRYDDYSTISDPAVDRGLLDILRRSNVSCTFGIIPAMTSGEVHVPGEREEFPLDDEKLALIRPYIEDRLVDPAVHGWNHRTHAGALPPTPSEFFGLPIEQQQDRIERACHFFEQSFGSRPATFIPPWNSYDTNTLAVLDRAGITRISGNREGPVALSGRMRFAPITIEMRDLRQAIDAARQVPDEDVAIGVMCHPYDFRESGDPRSSYSLAEFEAEVRWLKSCDDVVVGSIAHIVDTTPGMDADRFAYNREWAMERSFPPFIRRTQSSPLYRSTGRARGDKIARSAASFAVHALLLIATLVVVKTVLAVIPFASAAAIALALVAGLAFLVIAARAVRKRAIYFKAAAMLSVFAGALLGSLV